MLRGPRRKISHNAVRIHIKSRELSKGFDEGHIIADCRMTNRRREATERYPRFRLERNVPSGKEDGVSRCIADFIPRNGSAAFVRKVCELVIVTGALVDEGFFVDQL